MDVLRGNPPLLHLGDDVLQDVGVAMTSVLHLGNNIIGNEEDPILNK